MSRIVLHPLVGTMSDAEEISQLLRAETCDVLAGLLIQRVPNKSALLLLQSDDAVLDCLLDEHAVDLHRARLANAVGAVDGLLFNKAV